MPEVDRSSDVTAPESFSVSDAYQTPSSTFPQSRSRRLLYIAIAGGLLLLIVAVGALGFTTTKQVSNQFDFSSRGPVPNRPITEAVVEDLAPIAPTPAQTDAPLPQP